jgi:hypothetical protein
MMEILKVTANAAPSAQIKIEQIETRLRGQLGGRVRELNLVLRENGIVLQGFARTYYAKQLAQHAVMRETELPIASNEIEVC